MTDIGSVPYWDTYYGYSTPQDWSTDGVSLFDSAGNAVASIGDASGVATTASSSDSTLGSMMASLSAAIPSIVTGLSTIELAQLNIQRAKQGLPALNAAAYGPQIGIGLSSSTTSMIMLIALGIGAIMLLKR